MMLAPQGEAWSDMARHWPEDHFRITTRMKIFGCLAQWVKSPLGMPTSYTEVLGSSIDFPVSDVASHFHILRGTTDGDSSRYVPATLMGDLNLGSSFQPSQALTVASI